MCPLQSAAQMLISNTSSLLQPIALARSCRNAFRPHSIRPKLKALAEKQRRSLCHLRHYSAQVLLHHARHQVWVGHHLLLSRLLLRLLMEDATPLQHQHNSASDRFRTKCQATTSALHAQQVKIGCLQTLAVKYAFRCLKAPSVRKPKAPRSICDRASACFSLTSFISTFCCDLPPPIRTCIILHQ